MTLENEERYGAKFVAYSIEELVSYLNDTYLRFLWPDYIEKIEQLVIHNAVKMSAAMDIDMVLDETFTTLNETPRFVAIPGGVRFELPEPTFEASPESLENQYLVQTVVEFAASSFTLEIRFKLATVIGDQPPVTTMDVDGTHSANDPGAAIIGIITTIMDLNGKLKTNVEQALEAHVLPGFSTFRFVPPAAPLGAWETISGATQVYSPSRISVGFVADGFDEDHIHLFDGLVDQIADSLFDPDLELHLPRCVDPAKHVNEPFAQFRRAIELRKLRIIADDAAQDSIERIGRTFADPVTGTTKMGLGNLARFAAAGLSQGGNGLLEAVGGLPDLMVVLTHGHGFARAVAMGNVTLVPVRSQSWRSVGQLVGTDALTANQDVFASFTTTDPKTNKPASSHLITMNSTTGNLRRIPIEPDGSLSKITQSMTVEPGFDHVLTYTKLGKDYLLLCAQEQEQVAIYRIEPDGTIGEDVTTAEVITTWNLAMTYTVGGETYVAVSNKGSGSTRPFPVQNDGSLGAPQNWTGVGQGWKYARAYEIEGKPRIYVLDPEAKRGKVIAIDDDGTFDHSAEDKPFLWAFSDIHFYTVGRHTYAVLLATEDTCTLEVYLVEPDGSLGLWIDRLQDAEAAWSGLTTYRAGGRHYLAVYDSQTGQMWRRQLHAEDDQIMCTLLHELAHTPLGHLGDEYVDKAKENQTYMGLEPVQANLTKDPSGTTVKWAHWVGATPKRPWDLPIGAPVEGALTFGKGAYRPAESCMMFASHAGVPFCAVCREELTSSITDALHLDFMRLSLRMVAPLDCDEPMVLDVIGSGGVGVLPAGTAMAGQLTTFAARILSCPLPEPWVVSYRLFKGGTDGSVIVGPSKANSEHAFDLQAVQGDLLEVTITSACDFVEGESLGSFTAKVEFSGATAYPDEAPSMPPSLHQSVPPGATVTPYYDPETGVPRMDLELGALRGAVAGYGAGDPCTLLTSVDIKLMRQDEVVIHGFGAKQPGKPAFIKPDLIDKPGPYRWEARTRTELAASPYRAPEPDGGPHFVVNPLGLAKDPQPPAKPQPHTYELVDPSPITVGLSATSWDLNGDDLRLEFQITDSYQDFAGVATHTSAWLPSPGSGAPSLAVTGSVEVELSSLHNKWRVRAIDKNGLTSEWANGPFVVVENNHIETASGRFHQRRAGRWTIPYMDRRMNRDMRTRPAALDDLEGVYEEESTGSGVRVWSVPSRRGTQMVMSYHGQRVMSLLEGHQGLEMRELGLLNRRSQLIVESMRELRSPDARRSTTRLDAAVRRLARDEDATEMANLTRRLVSRALPEAETLEDVRLLGTVTRRSGTHESFVELRFADRRDTVRLLWHGAALVGFGYGVVEPMTPLLPRGDTLVAVSRPSTRRQRSLNVVRAVRRGGEVVGITLAAQGRRGVITLAKVWPEPEVKTRPTLEPSHRQMTPSSKRRLTQEAERRRLTRTTARRLPRR